MICSILQAYGFQNTTTAKSVREALMEAEKCPPELAILDVMLPDGNGFDLMTQLKKKEMTNDSLVYSIRELTELLEKHYGSKVIVLIDEYDVPLAKANENGYYDEMVLLIRNLFENALKTNSSLKFAVLTGCLRIAKESIFTGLNNFKVYSITDKSFDETFGFTDAEVKELLRYYGQEKYYETVKEWYDGYRFGNVDVYCPWDVSISAAIIWQIPGWNRRITGRIQVETV